VRPGAAREGEGYTDCQPPWQGHAATALIVHKPRWHHADRTERADWPSSRSVAFPRWPRLSAASALKTHLGRFDEKTRTKLDAKPTSSNSSPVLAVQSSTEL
jgi:hypothetical protein